MHLSLKEKRGYVGGGGGGGVDFVALIRVNSVLVTGNGTGRVELSIFGIERWVYN